MARSDKEKDKEKVTIDSGFFPTAEFKNDADRDAWLSNYGKFYYANDKDTQDLFSGTAYIALHNDDRRRQLRREERQNRRDFRRQARADYRQAKKQYKASMKEHEDDKEKYTTNKSDPEKPKRARYYRDTDAGKARRISRDQYETYLAYRDAYDTVENDLKERGMRSERGVGNFYADIDKKLAPYGNDAKGFVMYDGQGQDFVDLNEDYIKSGDAYFEKLANAATVAEQQYHADKWEEGKQKYVAEKAREAGYDSIDNALRREKIAWEIEYSKKFGNKPVVNQYATYHFSKPDGRESNSKARGGRLPKAPTRDKYGNKIARADNLGTRDYDVYF